MHCSDVIFSGMKLLTVQEILIVPFQCLNTCTNLGKRRKIVALVDVSIASLPLRSGNSSRYGVKALKKTFSSVKKYLSYRLWGAALYMGFLVFVVVDDGRELHFKNRTARLWWRDRTPTSRGGGWRRCGDWTGGGWTSIPKGSWKSSPRSLPCSNHEKSRWFPCSGLYFVFFHYPYCIFTCESLCIKGWGKWKYLVI